MLRCVLLSMLVLILGAVEAGSAEAGESAVPGETIYKENCAACHDEKGDGKGPEAKRLKTKPRDFTRAIYKFRSTPSGSLPLDTDLFRTIRSGVRGTSMLAQLQLSERETRSVVEYIKAFSSRFATEKAASPIEIPPKPSFTSDLISLGKSEYAEGGCPACHGETGSGNGPSAKELKDEWGYPISPTDLTVRPFKSGPNPEDLYRTLSTGLNGTPMPSYANVFSPKERWALVSYLVSIAVKEKSRGMMGLVGEEFEGMQIDMRAAMAGMMGGRGMMGRGGGMMNRGRR